MGVTLRSRPTMHLLLLPLVTMLATTTATESMGSCNFSRDCKQYSLCQTIQDAACVCNFGECVIRGNPFFRGKECDAYTDCGCSSDPENCSCDNGFCQTAPVECHRSQDCGRMEKCAGRECNCQGNLCSWECDTTSDCESFYCNKALGWKCECQASLCKFVKKPVECDSIRDCVSKGLCQDSLPCACTQNYCQDPYWVNDAGNCRKNQDCEDSILNCKGKKCVCANMVAINKWEMKGTCEVNTKGARIHFPTA